jgi:hypothetical protein
MALKIQNSVVTYSKGRELDEIPDKAFKRIILKIISTGWKW